MWNLKSKVKGQRRIAKVGLIPHFGDTPCASWYLLTSDDMYSNVGHAAHTGVTRVLSWVCDTCLLQQQEGSCHLPLLCHLADTSSGWTVGYGLKYTGYQSCHYLFATFCIHGLKQSNFIQFWLFGRSLFLGPLYKGRRQ